MTTERDSRTRVVLSWLREDAHENAERVLLRALDEVDTTPQRRSWWPARRFLDMSSSTKIALAAAAVVVALVVGSQLLPRTGGSGGDHPTATAPANSPTTTPSDNPSVPPGQGPVAYSSTPATGLLAPGSIVLDGPFPLAVAFDVPAGWTRDRAIEGTDLAGIHKVRGDLAPVWTSWAIIDNVYPNPCRSARGPADPPIGPTVDDLVTALRGMKGFDSTTPTDITIDGHAGKRFEITATVDPATDGCDDSVWLPLWVFPNQGGPGQVPGGAELEFWIVDVDGTRLVMFTENYGATEAEVAEAQGIMISVRFE